MPADSISPSPPETLSRVATSHWEWLTHLVVWVFALEFVLYTEANRLRERLEHLATAGWWVGDPHPDATFLLPWLLLAPFCFLFPLSWNEVARWLPRLPSSSLGQCSPWVAQGLLIAVVTLTSVSMSFAVSRFPLPSLPSATYGDTGPYIHDEFSYRFQAQTYLEGRWWWPGVPKARELFHQMHVLNEDRFASRYFPGTGLWFAPFVVMGFPVGASWLAGAMTANLAAIIVQRRHGFSAGLLAGLLVALSPGQCLIDNLLLAHGPTLVGLMVCLYSFCRLFETITWRWAGLAGTGLAFAMLCRPLTAASVALPFGVWWFSRGIFSYRHRTPEEPSAWWLGTVAMGVPLLLGFALIGWQNMSITGRLTQTPYSQYNQLYTPRHVFAFRETTALTDVDPKRHQKEYDEWAQPLTWNLALTNAEMRLRNSLAWSLGIVPLGMAGLYFVLNWSSQTLYERYIFASIAVLHLAHMPYWLSGILGYHYVFESGVLSLMLTAGVVVHVSQQAWATGRCLVPMWLTGLLGLAVMVNFLPIAPGTTVPRLRSGLESITHAAARYDRFHQTLASGDIVFPALVLVKTSPEDLHIEYVRNAPPFDGPLLVGRYRPALYPDAELRQMFADRHLYVYETSSGTLKLLNGSTEPNQ